MSDAATLDKGKIIPPSLFSLVLDKAQEARFIIYK
jgi:hypothetical protein